jgi:hypothetical protein
MRLTRSRVLAAGGVGFLLLTGWWIFRSNPTTASGKATPSSSGSPTSGLVFSSLKLFGYALDGQRQWSLTALNASISADQRTVSSTGIRDGVFFKGKVVVARFSAGRALYDNISKDLSLDGPIDVSASNGVHLECGHLSYSDHTHRLTALSPLRIQTPRSIFTAGRVDADLALDEFRCSPVPGRPVLLTSSAGGAI